jgi:hypothetical protein
MSSLRPQSFDFSHLPNLHQYSEADLATLQPSFAIDNNTYFDHDSIIAHFNELLHDSNRHCMNDASRPNINLQPSTPAPLPLTCDVRQDSVISAGDWQMYQNGMGGPAVATQRPWKRARTGHQRTPSASTIASTGPASPYTATTSYPHIANTEFDPHSPAQQAAYADQAGVFSKNLPTPQQTPTDLSFMNSAYIPSQSAHTPSAHLAMKGFAIDHHHHLADDFPPEFYTSSRHSMSSHGNNSPATPQSGVGESYDPKNFMNNQNGEADSRDYEGGIDCLLSDALDFRQSHPQMQLFQRTDSQAFQDELYNPQPNYTSTPMSASKRQSDFLSPHRNLISERLQTANLARTGSPTSALSRERSPFRDGSPLAPANDWNSMGTAAQRRQQQKEEAEQVEYAQHQQTLRREPTKTISPKDAMLDYAETDQQPLFQDSIPAGYRQHTGATESWQNNYVSAGSTFGNLVATGGPQDMTAFRAASADDFSGPNFNFMQLPHGQQNQVSQIQGPSYPANSYVAPKMEYQETNPEFPAHLTRMESSVSETGGLPLSSQESFNVTSTPQRPADTRANAGVYTCTYHGCTHRFDTPANLQKHKRDYHRSQQQRESISGTNTDTTTSPRSTESPAPSTDGMTPAAILARNSQAGPHKCTRINPSTNKPCNTIFSRPYDLTRHEDTIHNNRKTKVRCPMCREEKTFSRNDALTRHMRVVHPDVESFGKRGRRGD